jgi:hypothetical protein
MTNSVSKESEYQKRYLKKHPWVVNLNCIKSRCRYKSHDCYKYYGGKGIKCLITLDEIKELWFRDGAKNMKRPSIDRLDNNGNYTFSNCRFVELSENSKESAVRTIGVSVARVNKDGTETIYKTIADAERDNRQSKRTWNISNAINGNQKTAYGFRWRRT